MGKTSMRRALDHETQYNSANGTTYDAYYNSVYYSDMYASTYDYTSPDAYCECDAYDNSYSYDYYSYYSYSGSTYTYSTPSTADSCYDTDTRDLIDGFYVRHDKAFVSDASYNQITLAEMTDTLSFEDAMDKAVAEAKSRNAYGFFYQQHSNGYQIAGFFSDEAFLSDETKWQGGGGHRRFALVSLTDIREN